MTDSRAALGNRGGHAESVDRVAAGHPPAHEHDTIAVVVEPEGLNGVRRVSAVATAPRPAKARVDRSRRTAMAIIGRGLTLASGCSQNLICPLAGAAISQASHLPVARCHVLIRSAPCRACALSRSTSHMAVA